MGRSGRGDGNSDTATASRATRERNTKSYVEEDFDSEEEKVEKVDDEDFKEVSDPETPSEQDSDSDFEAESSGSEYGKKKKPAPRVAKRGRGRPVESESEESSGSDPEYGKKKKSGKAGKGRGRPAAKKAASPKRKSGRVPAKKNGQSKRKKESSDEDSFEDEAPPPKKTPNETNLSTIEFKTEKKSSNGDAANFKIISWNVGGIKACIKKGCMSYLEAEDADVVCLQELRAGDAPDELEKNATYPHFSFLPAESKGHHGVAVLSKEKPISVVNGLPEETSDEPKDLELIKEINTEGRLITAEFEKFYIINAYVPNSGRAVKSEGRPKPYPPKVTNGIRPAFDALFRKYLKGLKKPIILTGDLNVAHKEIDLANPKTNTSTAGFTIEEREGMDALLTEVELFDSFRELAGDEKGAYTFWSYMHNAREKNTGWRLDYFLLSKPLKDSLVDHQIRKDVFGSDHCPIVLFMAN